MPKKIVRITTVPLALHTLLKGQMNFMQLHGFEVVMISAGGPELEAVKQNEGCRHILVPLTRKITPLQDFKCLITLIKILRKEKPDIVHSHTPKAGLLGMIAAKFCCIKIRIHTVAGLPMMVEKGFKFRLLKFIEKLTYTCASYVWPNSHSLVQYILQQKLTTAKKLYLIGKGSSNGINISKFNAAALQPPVLEDIKTKINYSSQYQYLLCISRLVKDKGIVELVDVFTELQSNNSSLKLILAGNFEETLDPLPNETIQTIKTNPGIIYTGWTDNVEYYMHLANYFVFPSHREGFPNVLLQAGAMHLPIICSRIAGNVDIVEHHKTGLIFQTGNKKEILQQIQFALHNKTVMVTMADTLLYIIQENYSQQQYWNVLLKQYNTLINSAI
jgi:glycosyltransferase involved in cell wall biosynthesis